MACTAASPFSLSLRVWKPIALGVPLQRWLNHLTRLGPYGAQPGERHWVCDNTKKRPRDKQQFDMEPNSSLPASCLIPQQAFSSCALMATVQAEDLKMACGVGGAPQMCPLCPGDPSLGQPAKVVTRLPFRMLKLDLQNQTLKLMSTSNIRNFGTEFQNFGSTLPACVLIKYKIVTKKSPRPGLKIAAGKAKFHVPTNKCGFPLLKEQMSQTFFS